MGYNQRNCNPSADDKEICVDKTPCGSIVNTMIAYKDLCKKTMENKGYNSMFDKVTEMEKDKKRYCAKSPILIPLAGVLAAGVAIIALLACVSGGRKYIGEWGTAAQRAIQSA